MGVNPAPWQQTWLKPRALGLLHRAGFSLWHLSQDSSVLSHVFSDGMENPSHGSKPLWARPQTNAQAGQCREPPRNARVHLAEALWFRLN